MAAPGGPSAFRGPPPGAIEGGPRPTPAGMQNGGPPQSGPYGRIPSFGSEGEPPMKRMREGNGPPPPMWGGPGGPGPRPPMQDPGKDRSMASVFYKTRMCKNLAFPGGCPYHEKCNYAHSEEELRTLPPEYAGGFLGAWRVLHPTTTTVFLAVVLLQALRFAMVCFVRQTLVGPISRHCSIGIKLSWTIF